MISFTEWLQKQITRMDSAGVFARFVDENHLDVEGTIQEVLHRLAKELPEVNSDADWSWADLSQGFVRARADWRLSLSGQEPLPAALRAAS